MLQRQIDRLTRQLVEFTHRFESGFPDSITQTDVLERELALIRRLGYSRDNEELELGVRCIAAGIYDDTGTLQAGLSISAPADRLRDDWIPAMLRISQDISSALGYEKREK